MHFLTTSTQPSEDSKIILLTFLLAVLAIGILDNSKVDFRQFQRRAASINKFQSRSDRLVPQDNSKVDFRQFQLAAASQKNPKSIDWFDKTIPKSIFDNSSVEQRPKKIQRRSIGSTRPFQSRFSTIPACSSVPKKTKVDRLVRQDHSKVDFRQFQRRAASQKNPKSIDWFDKIQVYRTPHLDREYPT